MNTLRTFIAIELTNNARTALSQLQNRLKTKVPPHAIRWVAPQTMHLTLHFLGDVPAQDVEPITQAMRAVATSQSPFQLTLTGLGCFPNMNRPRVVWVGVGGEIEILTRLHQHLGQRIAQQLDFKPEARPYSPHLTIGRVKKGLPPRQIRQLGPILEQEQRTVKQVASVSITDLHLFKSELTPKGPIYTSLGVVGLI